MSYVWLSGMDSYISGWTGVCVVYCFITASYIDIIRIQGATEVCFVYNILAATAD